MKRFVLLLLAMLLALPGLAAPARNVILMIADGCGAEHYTLARWVKGAPLNVDSICVGMVQTYIADSVIADSAPTASAYATGVRTNDKFISVGPCARMVNDKGAPMPLLSCIAPPDDKLECRPMPTILEGAKLAGKAVGVVSTSTFTHATPAAFYAHGVSRSEEKNFAHQAVFQNLDVVFGGGHTLLQQTQDGVLLTDILQANHYKILTTWRELINCNTKAFGMFAPEAMQPAIDRQGLNPEEPLLAEMTSRAIKLLSKDPDGFFLMVEGSQVDWGSHANDAAWVVGDLLAFDDAVKVVLNYAKADKQTLVIILSDHNNGGLTLGSRASNKSYSQTKIEALVNPLKAITWSSQRMWKEIERTPTPEHVQRVIFESRKHQITPEEAKRILDLAAPLTQYDKHYAIGAVLNDTYLPFLGWTTNGHSGGDVPLFAYGPERPVGMYDQPGINRVMCRALGVDLLALRDRLFVDMATAFPAGTWKIAGPMENRVVEVVTRGVTARLPINTNLLYLGGKAPIKLEGIVVHCEYATTNGKIARTFIPRQAVEAILQK